MMIRLRQIIILTTMMIIYPITVAHANIIWPAIYVASSHFRFWYVTVVGLTLEAFILKLWLIPDIKKAFFVSFVANFFSATIGIYLLVFGMVGWHLIVDIFVLGSFNILNKIATIVLMTIGSIILESIIVKILWKYRLNQTIYVFMIGNFLSYSVIAIDLFIFGGWHKIL